MQNFDLFHRQMRNISRIKECGDDISLHFVSVSVMIVVAIILLGVMNTMTMSKLDAMKRNNGKRTLVLLDPITGETRSLPNNIVSVAATPKNGSKFVSVKNKK